MARIVSALAPQVILETGEMMGVAAVAAERIEPGQSAPFGAISVARDGVSRIVAVAPHADERWDWMFAFRPQIAFSADGQRIAIISVDSLVREGGAFTVVQLDSRGDTNFVRSYPYIGERIPQRTIDSVTSLPPGRGRMNPDGPQMGVAIPRSRIPPVFAPVEAIGFTREAAIWVQLRATQDGKRVIVLGENGAVVAEIVIPANGRIAGLSATHAWVREADDDGLISVVRYRLRR